MRMVKQTQHAYKFLTNLVGEHIATIVHRPTRRGDDSKHFFLFFLRNNYIFLSVVFYPHMFSFPAFQAFQVTLGFLKRLDIRKLHISFLFPVFCCGYVDQQVTNFQRKIVVKSTSYCRRGQKVRTFDFFIGFESPNPLSYQNQ